MAIPTAGQVRQHEDRFPLNERGENDHDGIEWRHGACWLCRKPMLCSSQHFPSIYRLRERDGAVEVQLGWTQWERLDSMPWAEGAEWEPVDQRGYPVAAGAVEFVVVSKRRHHSPKRVIYQTKEGARRRFALLVHPRPWEALGEDPDAWACCSGRECGCGGLTVREAHEVKRRGVNEDAILEYARIDYRHASHWWTLEMHRPEREGVADA